VNEILDALIQIAAFALLSAGTAGVGAVAPRVARWLRLANDDRVRAYLLRAVEAAVEYGQAEARRRLATDARRFPGEGATLPQEGQANLAAVLARDYVQSRVPDALQHFGIDRAGVDQMIRARLPGPRPLVGG
jgi:hypothetical protein